MNKRIFLVAALALAAVACGDDDEAGPNTVIKSDGSINNPVIDAGAGIDSSTPASDASTDSGSDNNNNVKGAPGCFSGKPTTSKELLNACAEGYQVFDNTKRLPNFTGTLPPLN